jgi:hypothetical protein
VVSVRIKINGFSHVWPEDVDVFIKSPSGWFAPLFSDAGSFYTATDLDFVFSDSAATAVSEDDQLTSGTYQISNYDLGSDTDPVNGLLEVSSLNEFANGDVIGDWGLWVRDDEAAIAGTIDSWSLILETMPGPLVAARRNHSSTLLPSGKVLAAGGTGSGGYLTSAELYNPGTGTWSSTGTMITGRRDHTANLLPNGKTLICGGYNGAELADCELYDPVSGTWSATGSLGTTRTEHTATLLNNGKVLVTGGLTAGFTSQKLNIPAGYGMVTVFSNGIPSLPKLMFFNGEPVVLPESIHGDGFEAMPVP